MDPVREIPLSKGYVALVDEVDYERVMLSKWHAHGMKGYVYGRTNVTREGGVLEYKKVLLHRYILQALPHEQVDHENGNGLINTRKNIRVATVANNNCNQKAHPSNPNSLAYSRFRGVTRRESLWQARIAINRKRFSLGHFEDEIEAAKAYDVACLELHGEFGRLNFPDRIAA